MKGILGRKIGMTQVFDQDGKLTPVTVVEVTPNIVTQVKTMENDGYEAIQLAFDDKREKLATKASLGITSKANTTPKRFFKEIRGVDINNYQLGDEVTKGKGFQGNIKKYNQSRGPMGHGSKYHRGVGSLGTMLPKRVFKGRGLPSHMGVNTVTIQNLEIVDVDLENNAILVKGNIPGPKKGLVMIRSAVKNMGKVNKRAELVSYIKEEVKTNEQVETENTESAEA